jgi:hypothetical protein
MKKEKRNTNKIQNKSIYLILMMIVSKALVDPKGVLLND